MISGKYGKDIAHILLQVGQLYGRVFLAESSILC